MADRGRPRSFDRADALKRAMTVFWAQGYDGAAISDLTAAMGINSPSLYAAFGCKEALFREAVTLYGATYGATTQRVLAEEPTARSAIEAMLKGNAELFTEPELPHGCLVVLGVVHRTLENEAAHQFLADQRGEVLTAVRRRLDRAVADGELRDGLDLDALAAYYVTVSHGLSIRARDGSSRKMLLGVVRFAMATWDLMAPEPKGKKAAASRKVASKARAR